MQSLVAALLAHRWRGQLAEAERFLRGPCEPPEGGRKKLDAWLVSPAWEVRNAALKLISHWRAAERYPLLVAKLADWSEAGIVRRNAAEALARLGVATESARAALVGALGDPYWEVRAEAATALAALFAPASDLEAAVLDVLRGSGARRRREENFEVQMACALALGHLGSSQAAFEAVAALARDDSWLVRSQASVALAQLAGRVPEHYAEARRRLAEVDRLSEGCVSYFVHREVLDGVFSALDGGPQALSPERLRPLYLSPKAGWNRVRR